MTNDECKYRITAHSLEADISTMRFLKSHCIRSSMSLGNTKTEFYAEMDPKDAVIFMLSISGCSIEKLE